MKPLYLFSFFFICSQFSFGQPAFSKDLLSNPQQHATEFESIFVYKEVPVYVKNSKEKSIFLRNAYANSALQLPVSWPLKLKQYYVKEVRVIFTKYPIDKSFWNTNYYDLLAARLQAAFDLDGRLNDSKIIYSLILQTNCKTEEEAKLMLHTIEVVYEMGERKIEEEQELAFYDTLFNQNEDSLAWLSNLDKANRFLKKSKATDTIVLKSLEFFKFQDSLLIVIDCTGSMAPYYSQVSLWAARIFFPGHYYVMFNDAGPRSLPLGQTGGYVEGRVSSVSQLIKLFRRASAPRGANKEVAENDMEGILAGIQLFPDNQGIILLADNNACIRDYKLLSGLVQPVHIIPCGGSILNPQYLNMAWYTNGSVIWLDQRISDWTKLCDGNVFTIGETKYRFIKKQQKFEVLDHQLQHFEFCDAFTPKIKKKK